MPVLKVSQFVGSYARIFDRSLSIPVRVRFLCIEVCGRHASFCLTSIHLLSRSRELFFCARSSLILWRLLYRPSRACLKIWKVWMWVAWKSWVCLYCRKLLQFTNGPLQANLVLIAYASSEGSGEPAHSRSLARTSATRSYKQWDKRNLQTESQIPSPSEWLGMRS